MRGRRLKPAPDPVNKRTPSLTKAANVEVRWKKWCVSKNTQSCKRGNRLCKSSPYFLCDYGEKEAKTQNAVPAGGLSQVQPRATAQSPPGRAAHSPYGVRALSALSPQIVSSGRCKKVCVFFSYTHLLASAREKMHAYIFSLSFTSLLV